MQTLGTPWRESYFESRWVTSWAFRLGILLGPFLGPFWVPFLGPSLGHSALLATFLLAFWRFLRPLGRSGIDFEGLWGLKNLGSEGQHVSFFVAASFLYACVAELFCV